MGSIDDKRQLLFLHGYLADKRCFSYQYAYFEKYFEIFALDLKGFGENADMEYPYSLDDYIMEVKEFCYKKETKVCIIFRVYGSESQGYGARGLFLAKRRRDGKSLRRKCGRASPR